MTDQQPADHHGTPGERDRRLAADIALGSVRAEGGEPSPETIDLIERSVAGELSPQEVHRRTVERHRRT